VRDFEWTYLHRNATINAMSVLPRREIARLIAGQKLIESYVNLDEQLQPNGFDLTLRSISMLQTPGVIPASNTGRAVSQLAPLVFDGLGYIDLVPCIYSITYNEVVNLPKNVMALARPRSSLLRCGVSVGTAVWDAGYSGRSESLLIVYNSQGFRIQRNARIVQLVFYRLEEETEGYNGKYQGENIT
jgi:dUTP pyrophosphatase